MNTIKRIALVLVIIGALNWGLIGLFRFDLVAAVFGGQDVGLSRVIYSLIGLSGLVSLTIFSDLFRVEDMGDDRDIQNLGYGTEFGEEADLTIRDERARRNDDDR